MQTKNAKVPIDSEDSVNIEQKARKNPDILDKPSGLRYLPLLIWVVLFLNLVNSCSNSQKLKLAIQNKPYIYVQTLDGEIVKAKPVDSLHREEVVVKKFGENWLKVAYTWQNTPTMPKDDQFVSENAIQYPQSYYLASLAIVPGYREAYMKSTFEKYRKQFPFEKYLRGEYQSYVRIFNEPIIMTVKDEQGKIIPGMWDVKIVATRTHAQEKSIVAHEVLNRVIRLRAVKPSDDRYLWGDKTSDLGRLLNQMQKQGLQIIEITEF